METNQTGGKSHRMDYDPTQIPIEAMIPLAKLLTEESVSHGRRNWEKLPVEEQLKHLYAHYLEFETKAVSTDTDRLVEMDYHLIRILARAMFAYVVFKKHTTCPRG